MLELSITLGKLMNAGKLSPDQLRALLDHEHINLSNYIEAMSLWDRISNPYSERYKF